jgi:DNA-binding NtrC family response regulator
MSHSVLVVDDDCAMCELLAESLAPLDFEVTFTTDPRRAEALVGERHFDAVITDVNMRGLDGLELCRRLLQRQPDLPVIVLTAFGNLDTAVRAIRAGAYDFLTKPLDIDVVTLALQRAVGHGALRREVEQLKRVVARTRGFGELVGSSPAMRAVYDLVERAAPAEASVLISGESGTGKEVVARALHAKSRRAGGPFVAVNAAALPEALLESELFGHEKGAFTDARAARPGLFAEASSGTLFLDEIADLPLPLQPKLLRALQERRVRPVGSDREVPIDVRVIAATNRDLQAAIEEKRFREDLYYRIDVIHVALPPLRARGGDIIQLAQHFLERFAAQGGKTVRGISEAASARLLEYPWPGNVRELSNSIERAVALCRSETIELDDLPDRVRGFRAEHVLVSSRDPSVLVTLEEVERRYVLRVLEATAGNKSEAARILGLDRKTLQRKLELNKAESGSRGGA